MHGLVFTCTHAGVCNRVCVSVVVCTNRWRVHWCAPTGCATSQPASQLCKTRCNRALSRLPSPPELSRHDPDSSTRCAHSCSWPLRLKHDGSNWRARARCGFHVRTGVHTPTDVCNRVHGGVHVCTVHEPVVCSQPTSCAKHGATGRRRGSGNLPGCPDTIRIALLNAHTVAVGRSG